jgi:hypothetical protein
VYATVWFVAFICFAIFFRDPNYTGGEIGAAIVLVLLGLWPAILYSREPFEVALGDDGVCEFRAPLRRKRVRVQQIKSIRGDDEEQFEFVIRYEGGRVHLEGYDFVGLLIELVNINPAIKVDIGEGWLQRLLYDGRAHPGGPVLEGYVGSGDDWVRQFRESASKNRRRQDWVDRIGYSLLILFIWFWFSFMSWGLSFFFFKPHSRLTWLVQIARVQMRETVSAARCAKIPIGNNARVLGVIPDVCRRMSRPRDSRRGGPAPEGRETRPPPPAIGRLQLRGRRRSAIPSRLPGATA